MATEVKEPRVSVKERVMDILSDNEGGLTTAEVVRVLGHKQQGRTFKTIKGLREDDGFVTTKEVQRDPEKKAKSKVHTLTAKGKKALVKMHDSRTEADSASVESEPEMDGDAGKEQENWPAEEEQQTA